MQYRNDIPPEMRVLFHLNHRILDGWVRHRPRTATSTFSEKEHGLMEWYDSLTPTEITAILGDTELKRLVERQIDALSHKQQTIIRLRYGWEDGKVRTQAEVGSIVGSITGGAASHIESQALRLLRYSIAVQPEIRAYLRDGYRECMLSMGQIPKTDMPRRLTPYQLRFLQESYVDGDLREKLPDMSMRFKDLRGKQKESLLRLATDVLFGHYGGPQTAQRVGVPIGVMYGWRGRYRVTV